MYDLLDRLRIVESSAFVAAPLAGMTLAQLGAEVIRVDMIGGGLDFNRWPLSRETGRSLYWAGMNKGKKSLAVNLRDPRGRELVQDLATRPGEDAGILLTTFADAAWLSQEALAAKRADAISVAVKGSPDAAPAVDYTINCAVGYPHLTGPDTTPVNNVLPGWDIGTGLHAALALVAAVDRRRRTGEGGRAEVALSDVAMAMVGNLGQIAEVQVNGHDRGPIGNDLYGAFGRDFATGDGRRVMISAITVKQWKGLCRAAGIEETVRGLEAALGVDFDQEGLRYEWRKVLFALIEKWCAGLTLAEAGEALIGAGVTWGPYQTVGQMLADDWRASETNPMFETVVHSEVGPVLTPGSPIEFAGLPRVPVAPAPKLGEHTDQILAEAMGLDSGAIGRLHDDGIVAGPA